MLQQLQARLQELKTEYSNGQQVLAELESKHNNIQSTLLRIQGAIQVLEEALSTADIAASDAPVPLEDFVTEAEAVAPFNGSIPAEISH